MNVKKLLESVVVITKHYSHNGKIASKTTYENFNKSKYMFHAAIKTGESSMWHDDSERWNSGFYIKDRIEGEFIFYKY